MRYKELKEWNEILECRLGAHMCCWAGKQSELWSLFSTDELGDFLLEEAIPPSIVTSFTGMFLM